ncbi:MAG TPA: RNA polymerase sigma factor [Bacteroidales bacterium]|jgi:RNA polymerase sigma-70 factor (ECF subfamily)|nr:RNA polymerase sigma factor [Bacteroidales bacterium]HNV96516.1 RNA polymerase sigma factor [Bacteroidales bacterium]HOU99129.1 RNA polymerase sigma factor [Bacteroidales bacterium]
MKQFRSDNEIIEDIKRAENSHLAFRELIEKYQQPLYWHIRKIVIDHDDTDDILQNTFIKVWKSIGEFKQQSKLYTWLYRVATNESLTFLRNKNRRTFFNIDSLSAEWDARLESDPYFNGDEAELVLQKAILTLPEKQRIVFNMRYYDEISYKDMSEILETSEGALKASYHHAVQKIEKLLKQSLNLSSNE